jgi:hypothetical protein
MERRMVSEQASQQAFLGIPALPFAASAAMMAWMRMSGQTWPGRINRFRRNHGLAAIRGLEALEFLERSRELAAEAVIATPARLPAPRPPAR